jgi:hypothetical protein
MPSYKEKAGKAEECLSRLSSLVKNRDAAVNALELLVQVHNRRTQQLDRIIDLLIDLSDRITLPDSGSTADQTLVSQTKKSDYQAKISFIQTTLEDVALKTSDVVGRALMAEKAVHDINVLELPAHDTVALEAELASLDIAINADLDPIKVSKRILPSLSSPTTPRAKNRYSQLLES